MAKTTIKAIALMMILILTAAVQAGSVLYVDDDAPPEGDGTSWNSAFRFLQDALTEAANGGIVEIRVAQGVYRPDRSEKTPGGTGDRETSFQLENGVALMGGYAGIGADDPDERDIDLFETMLSGDLLGDDLPKFGNNDENSFHVVTASATDGGTVLAGFTITAGHANGPAFPENWSRGAGMFNEQAAPTIIECTFIENKAVNVVPQNGGAGGGMYNLNSDPQVIQCQFIRNVGGPGGGGGMRNSGSDPLVIDCTFYQNGVFVNFGGAGMNNFQSNPLIIGCLFLENISDTGTHGHGGGLRNQSSTPIVINCVFKNNSTDGCGGGMSSVGNDTDPVIINCLFVGNEADLDGGAMCSNHTSEPQVINCTVTANISGGDGGGLRTSGTASVSNSIFWNNFPNQLSGGETLSVKYSTVQGGWFGTGNIDTDPMFVDPDSDDYHLLPGSPSIDAADNTAVPKDIDTDLDGDPRFVDDPDTKDTGNGDPPIVDMGAYEFQVMNCPWDVNGDSVVDRHDLVEVVHNLGVCDDPDNCPWDVNGDGVVNGRDVAAVATHFGACP